MNTASTKVIRLFRSTGATSPRELAERLAKTHADLPGVVAVTANPASAEQRGHQDWSGYLTLWVKPPNLAELLALGPSSGDGHLVATPFQVTETPVIPRPAADGLVKIIYWVTKKDRLSWDEFVEHWMTTHATLAQAMTTARGYAINVGEASAQGRVPYDGYAALWLDTRRAAVEAWGTEAGKATALDGEIFMQVTPPALIVSEIPVIGSTGEGLA